jgi:hypothetical protein
MSRRIAGFSLLAAWLFASGVLLDATQVLAWTRMFAGYAGHESISAAAKDTFDPARPCAICRAVGKAREASKAGPVAQSKTVKGPVMIFQPIDPLVIGNIELSWPAAPHERAPARCDDVQSPPPRGCVS